MDASQRLRRLVTAHHRIEDALEYVYAALEDKATKKHFEALLDCLTMEAQGAEMDLNRD